MSLINEALKRTRDNLPAPPPTGTLPYQTPPRVPPPTRRGSPKPLMIALALVVVLLLAGSLITLQVARTMLVRSQPARADIAPPATPTPATEPLPVTVPVAEELPAAEPSPATVEAPPPAPVETPAIPAAPPEPPKLVLQGITVDPAVREALINGEVVRVGDSLAGVTVVAIEPRRVTVRWQDSELVLRMP